MQEKPMDEGQEIDLLELFGVLWKRIWIIALCFCVGAVGMALYTKILVTPMYQATATIYVLSGDTISVGELQLGSQVSPDYVEIARSRTTLKNTLARAGLEDKVSLGELAGGVSVVNQEGTHFMKVSVTNANPEYAQKLANTLAEEMSDRVVTVMNMEKPSTVEKALQPEVPVSPNLIKNIALGGLVGAVLAAGLIVLLHLMDDTIKNEEDVRKYLGLNVLASLPDTKEGRRKRRAA